MKIINVNDIILCVRYVFMKNDENNNLSILEKYDNHKLEMKIMEDKENFDHNKDKYQLRIALISLIVMFTLILIISLIASLSPDKNPSLEKYNTLRLGMTYEECKNILGSDGHIVDEDNNASTYVWYDGYCSENCPIIIQLNFKDNKLISRTENGLK